MIFLDSRETMLHRAQAVFALAEGNLDTWNEEGEEYFNAQEFFSSLQSSLPNFKLPL